jgi:hypothetical protein
MPRAGGRRGTAQFPSHGRLALALQPLRKGGCAKLILPFRFQQMAYATDNVFWVFHPRSMTNGERQVLRGWTEAIRLISASVNERLRHDPVTYRRILLFGRVTKRPLYIIYSHKNTEAWVIVSSAEREEVGRFPTLSDALDYISPMEPSARTAESPSVDERSKRAVNPS